MAIPKTETNVGVRTKMDVRNVSDFQARDSQSKRESLPVNWKVYVTALLCSSSLFEYARSAGKGGRSYTGKG